MAEQIKNPPQVDERTLALFEGNLQRIFAMKISHSTFRELQNVILSCANQDKELATFLFETLLTGQVKAGGSKQKEALDNIIKNFTISARLAKEVFERGEFINIITSDLLTQQDQSAFLNRIRRIDGEEFVFMSDPENTCHLLDHFTARIHELSLHPQGKKEIEKYKKQLHVLSDRLRQLLNS